MEWLNIHDNQPITKISPLIYGFTYVIQYTDECFYYGKKSCKSTKNITARKDGKKRDGHIKFFNKRKKMTKKELNARTRAQLASNVTNKIVKMETVTSESNWREYTGSSKNICNREILNKFMIEPAFCKKQLSYLEEKLLFSNNALENKKCLNEAITDKYSINDINEWRNQDARKGKIMVKRKVSNHFDEDRIIMF